MPKLAKNHSSRCLAGLVLLILVSGFFAFSSIQSHHVSLKKKHAENLSQILFTALDAKRNELLALTELINADAHFADKISLSIRDLTHIRSELLAGLKSRFGLDLALQLPSTETGILASKPSNTLRIQNYRGRLFLTTISKIKQPDSTFVYLSLGIDLLHLTQEMLSPQLGAQIRISHDPYRKISVEEISSNSHELNHQSAVYDYFYAFTPGNKSNSLVIQIQPLEDHNYASTFSDWMFYFFLLLAFGLAGYCLYLSFGSGQPSATKALQTDPAKGENLSSAKRLVLDLKPPLAAIEIVAKLCPGIPPDKIQILRGSVSRIKDACDNFLVQSQTTPINPKSSAEHPASSSRSDEKPETNSAEKDVEKKINDSWFKRNDAKA